MFWVISLLTCTLQLEFRFENTSIFTFIGVIKIVEIRFSLKRVIMCSIKAFRFFVRCIFLLISDYILLGEINSTESSLRNKVCQNKLQPPYPEPLEWCCQIEIHSNIYCNDCLFRSNRIIYSFIICSLCDVIVVH